MPIHSRAPAAPHARRRCRPWAAVLPAAVLLLAVLLLGTGASRLEAPQPLPEFTQRSPQAWINSAPLSRADLAGKVVLIEAWSVS